MAVDNICRWWLGPVWKTGGETCVCVLPTGHDGWHRCTCSGEWQKCGHPPEEVTS